MKTIFFVLAALLIVLSALIVLNFWKYRFKGDKVGGATVILFILLLLNVALTTGYLLGDISIAGVDDEIESEFQYYE